MAKVSDLTIYATPGKDELIAKWSFSPGVKWTAGNYYLRNGSVVKVKSTATKYANGVEMEPWVKNHTWYITGVKDDAVFLYQNYDNVGEMTIELARWVKRSDVEQVRDTGTVDTNTLDHYEYVWSYDPGNTGYFVKLSSGTTTDNTLTVTPEDNAIKMRVDITPVSKTWKDSDNNEHYYWTGQKSFAIYFMIGYRPEKCDTPTLVYNAEKNLITASHSNITDGRTSHIYYELYYIDEDNNDYMYQTSAWGVVVNGATQVIFTPKTNSVYRVRAQSANRLYTSDVAYDANSTMYALEYSGYSDSVVTLADPPSQITSLVVQEGRTSVQVSWTKVDYATSYVIEYSEKQSYFDTGGSTSTQEVKPSGSATTPPITYMITGLEDGHTYFFRVFTVNASGQSLKPCGIKSVILGKKPDAPTTWSSVTTAITGETVNLYWVHNAVDGSSEESAIIRISFDGGKTYKEITQKNTSSYDDKDKTKSYSIDTSSYTEGTQIIWMVKTKGVANEYGDYSLSRTIDIYSRPTLTLSVTDGSGSIVQDGKNISAYPLNVVSNAGPSTQKVLGFYVEIDSLSNYTTKSVTGDDISVIYGQQLYYKWVEGDDVSSKLSLTITPGDVTLANGQSYRLVVTSSMNSGLSATAAIDFGTAFGDISFNLDATVDIDKVQYTAAIMPQAYTLSEDTYEDADVTMSVYRREYDGNLRLIQDGILPANRTTVTDPHMCMDYARYRIVAIDNTTGVVEYYDVPEVPVETPGIILQWNEKWTNYNNTAAKELTDPFTHTGSFLYLPYDKTVSEDSGIDSSLVEYIGRKHPVSYYGTQLGQKGSWSCDIIQEDTETIYALRRLQAWPGDVYVRESNGSGYWAQVSVSFTWTYNTPLIPVTIEVTRVEGDV